MFLIIKKIHPHIGIEDIENFVSAAIKAEFPNKHGAIKSIQIFELVDKKGHIYERHGLVRVGPDSIVTPLIKLLNHGAIHNLRFAVDPYFTRHWHNDRRANKSHNFNPSNKRKEERRRRDLERVVVLEKLFVYLPD
ncbi:MAG: hypothetical protein ABSB19_03225 [Methylomonas sp.]